MEVSEWDGSEVSFVGRANRVCIWVDGQDPGGEGGSKDFNLNSNLENARGGLDLEKKV